MPKLRRRDLIQMGAGAAGAVRLACDVPVRHTVDVFVGGGGPSGLDAPIPADPRWYGKHNVDGSDTTVRCLRRPARPDGCLLRHDLTPSCRRHARGNTLVWGPEEVPR